MVKRLRQKRVQDTATANLRFGSRIQVVIICLIILSCGRIKESFSTMYNHSSLRHTVLSIKLVILVCHQPG